MANYSDTVGYFCVESKTGKEIVVSTVKELLDDFKEVAGASPYSDQEIIAGEYVSFDTLSRWSFESVLELYARKGFDNWLDNFCKIQNVSSDLDGISITFKFADYEPGCDVFYESTTVLEFVTDKDSGKISCKMINESSDDIEINATNLADYMGLTDSVDTFTEVGVYEILRSMAQMGFTDNQDKVQEALAWFTENDIAYVDSSFEGMYDYAKDELEELDQYLSNLKR